MAKSRIIKDIANDTITLETALIRAMVIANDIGNDAFSQWIEKELSGYSDGDIIPNYRMVDNTSFKFTGTNGAYMFENSPLPLPQILTDLNPKFWNMAIYDGINSIQELLSDPKEKECARDLTYLAGKVYKANGLQCSSIRQVVPINAFQNVVNNVKTKLLQSLICLDKMYGSLDELDIDTSNKSPEEVERINNMIVNYIYGDAKINVKNDGEKAENIFECGGIQVEDNSIHVGDNSSIESSVVSSKNTGKIHNNKESTKEKWYSKIAWNIVVPIAVGVIVVLICAWLNLDN